jgi:hypothetical protein
MTQERKQDELLLMMVMTRARGLPVAKISGATNLTQRQVKLRTNAVKAADIAIEPAAAARYWADE